MNKVTSLLFFILFVFGVNSQEIQSNLNPSNEPYPCHQTIVLQKMQEKDPSSYTKFLEAQEALSQQTEESNLAALGGYPKGTVYTIPVVFHILHNNGTENISEAQIQDAIAVMNRDYRKLNSDANNVVSTFLPLVADVEIEFSLATIAPDGTCFEGITRTVSPMTAVGEEGQDQINAVINGNDVYQGAWPHNKYLNIIVCKNIGGAAGYAYLPFTGSQTSNENMYYNTIFVLHNYVGSIGTSSVYRSRTLTHEVGHWLNLWHLWGTTNAPEAEENCNDDDGVADTPNTKGWTSCNLSGSTCDGTLDNVENYMEYSYCSKMFTLGQASRMRTALTSSWGGRNNLWTQSNLEDVGVIEGGTSSCINVFASKTDLCEGGSVDFGLSASEPVLSYSWTFPGGTPSTSTAANPTITYNTSGVYNVTVSITTSSGSDEVTKEELITVNATPNVSISASQQTICEGESISLVASGASSYSWNNGLGSGSVKNVSPTTTTTYEVTGVSNGCSNTYSITITVLPAPNLTITATSTEICTGESVTITAGGANSYQWNDGLGTNNSITVSPEETTTYTVVGSNGTCEEERSMTITVSEYPDVSIEASNTVVCPEEIIILEATGAENYSWSPSTFLNTSTGNVVISTPTESITYTVTGSNICGTDEASIMLTVSSGSGTPDIIQTGNTLSVELLDGETATWYLNGIFIAIGESIYMTENGNYQVVLTSEDGCFAYAEGYFTGTAGIITDTLNDLSIYPNPTDGKVFINSSWEMEQLRILDHIGRCVLQFDNIKETSVEIDLSHLASGSYTIQIQNGAFVVNKKLILN